MQQCIIEWLQAIGNRASCLLKLDSKIQNLYVQSTRSWLPYDVPKTCDIATLNLTRTKINKLFSVRLPVWSPLASQRYTQGFNFYLSYYSCFTSLISSTCQCLPDCSVAELVSLDQQVLSPHSSHFSLFLTKLIENKYAPSFKDSDGALTECSPTERPDQILFLIVHCEKCPT